jgi:Ala-tRNA(Pro) deacylase
MPVKQLKEFLDAERVRYVTVQHSPAFTAQEVAASAHVCGNEIAKTVMVTLNGRMAMAVLPASRKLSFELLREATGAENVQLASEEAFRDLFPGCDVGGMPPFGNLFGMEVYASALLANEKQIAFNAGSHTELIRMAYDDFARLVQPKVARIAYGES